MANLQAICKRSEVGVIKPWTKTTAPAGFLLCDGTAVSRTTYVDLFGIISTTYGSGNGSTTFNVPNLQGKTPQGYDGSTYNLAGTGGANTVTVSVTNNQAVANNQAVTITGTIANTSVSTAQLASHLHNSVGGESIDASGTGFMRGAGDAGTQTVNSAGSGTGHTHTHTLSGTLTGTVTLGGTVAMAGTNTFSPYVVVNYIIRF